MKKVTALFGVLMVLFGISGFAFSRTTIEADVVDLNILVNGKKLEADEETPFLSYNGRTYVSLRSFLEQFHYIVRWKPKERITGYETDEIVAYEKKPDIPKVQNLKTAESIAKAVISEHYGNKVSEKTAYVVAKRDNRDANNPKSEMIVWVMFSSPDGASKYNESALEYDAYETYIEEHADVILSIDCNTGKIDITKEPAAM